MAHSFSPSPSLSTSFAFASMLALRTPSIPGRSTRRQFVLITALSLIILSANYIRNVMNGGHTTNITFKTFIEPITVVRTSTAWVPSPQGTDADLGGSRRVKSHNEAHGFKKVNWDDYKQAVRAHRYNRNGLLEVNPEGQHPIYDLIERGEAAWQAKLKKASRNLHEAVVEYKKRYGRDPPLGFDKWWRYVQENNVQLPDEYDQIHRDLEAFWGIEPRDLQAVEFMDDIWQDHMDKYTIGKLDAEDPIHLLAHHLPHNATTSHDMTEGGQMIINMLRKANLEQHIPPFRATFNPNDNPYMSTDWELWNQAVAYAKEGKTFSMLPPRPWKHHGWLSSCDPVSPAWTTPIDFDAPYPAHLRPGSDPMSPSYTRLFIHDHRATMDPCQHPHLLRQHGQFVRYYKQGQVPQTTIVPIFSYSPTMLHHDITAAIPLNWVPDVDRAADPAWEDKIDERLHWRGGNTGIYHSDEFQWRLSHRFGMVEWAQNNLYSSLRILGLGAKKGERVGDGVVVSKARWAPAMLDVGFSKKPTNCLEEDGTCEKLQSMFEWKKGVSVIQAGNFKYILDVDGNAWSSRFKRLITTSSCIFKATIYPEWFTDRIQPWVHYVPVQVDLSDLWDAFSFFRGDLNGESGHDDLGKKIGAQGRDWSLNFWRHEDLVAYNFRLLLEYARVMSTDRDSMSYIHPRM